jgi:hypothetical protein
LPALSRRLGLGSGHLTAGGSGGTGHEAIPIVAGGNMATSVSYGTVTFAALGTATLVCGGEVVGFGHPVLYSGPSSMTLHGSRTVLIQPDPVSSGFVLANVGAPVGAVDNDRLVGLHALTGAPPAGSLLTSRAVQGRSGYTATTRATVPSWLPDIAFLNLLTAQDRVLDRLGGGTVDVSWTIRGERPDGKPFAQRHRQTYRVVEDVSGAVANLLAEDLYRIHARGVHVDSVSTVSRLNDSTARYRVTGVQVQRGDSWVTVRTNRRTALPAGARTGFRVLLTSPQGQRTAVLRLTVPRKAAAHRGTLRVLSGGDGVRGLRHDQIRVSLRFPRAPGAAARPRAATVSLLNIVRGRLAAPVAAVR